MSSFAIFCFYHENTLTKMGLVNTLYLPKIMASSAFILQYLFPFCDTKQTNMYLFLRHLYLLGAGFVKCLYLPSANQRNSPLFVCQLRRLKFDISNLVMHIQSECSHKPSFFSTEQLEKPLLHKGSIKQAMLNKVYIQMTS